MDSEFRIFTESSEDMGVMFDTYKTFLPAINTFMTVIDGAVKKLIKDPTGEEININVDITTFKDIVTKPITPEAIDIRQIVSIKQQIKKFRREIDHLMDSYGKLRDRVAFGGNYVRAILKRPKVYSKEINQEAYAIINKNIRSVNRALDWLEKVIIDLHNMVDQDLNILALVNRVYRKRKIYEAGNILNSPIDYMREDDESALDTSELDMENPPEELPPAEDESSVKNEPQIKKIDKAEKGKNGVRRKKLYQSFIGWCKEYNSHNSFSNVFDKDAFKESYPFVPEAMRYFYRIANPMICVLADDLTFFPLTQLRSINAENPDFEKKLIFAATENDLRVFNAEDKKVYNATDEDGTITLGEVLGETFDLYIQDLINKGDILNGPIDDEPEEEITGV